jgi:DNA-binding transcriptional regulator YdaS (Cro superfamily)
MNATIAKAIEIVGTQREFARCLSISPGLVSQWKNGTRPVAANHCLAIEAVTKGAVKAKDLRPDVFIRPNL